MPIEWTEIFGEDVEDISGGEHHTLILFKNGDVYGAGKNDEGQLGLLNEHAEVLGSFKKLAHISEIRKLICSSHFSYGLNF